MVDEHEACAVGKEGDVIGLLFEEYRALRAEILTHINGLTTLLALLGVAAALLTSLGDGRDALFVIVVVAVFGMYFYYGRVRSIVRLSRQVAIIEQRINTLAERAYGCDRPILRWDGDRQSEPLSLFSPLFRLLHNRYR